MFRLCSTRARVLRLVAALGALPALWACTSHALAPPTGEPQSTQRKSFPVGQNRDLDLLFMVDNSNSMKGLQEKMARRLPDFMKVLKDLPGGLPNLHVAVVSSALGTGAVNSIGMCAPVSGQNDGGRFQHAAKCTALPAGETFLKATPAGNNFTGDIADVFACIAQLGDQGCGIEQQFESIRLALLKAADPNDPDNGGFLRPDATLGIVMVTNEDDCSLPSDSTLFDPSQRSVNDPLGGLQNYRCNEFGHLCGGQPLPHTVSQPVTLTDCAPAEDKGRLTSVAAFVDFVRGLKKDDPSKLFVAALAGEPKSYVIEPFSAPLGGGVSEIQPRITHSCAADANPLNDFADPAVRIAAFLNAFPPSNRELASICDDDFQTAMEGIARALSALVEPPCLEHPVALTRDGRPDCQVSLSRGAGLPDQDVHECVDGGTTFPCWRLDQPASCPGRGRVNVCWEATCTPSMGPDTKVTASATCTLGG